MILAVHVSSSAVVIVAAATVDVTIRTIAYCFLIAGDAIAIATRTLISLDGVRSVAGSFPRSNSLSSLLSTFQTSERECACARAPLFARDELERVVLSRGYRTRRRAVRAVSLFSERILVRRGVRLRERDVRIIG